MPIYKITRLREFLPLTPTPTLIRPRGVWIKGKIQGWMVNLVDFNLIFWNADPGPDSHPSVPFSDLLKCFRLVFSFKSPTPTLTARGQNRALMDSPVGVCLDGHPQVSEASCEFRTFIRLGGFSGCPSAWDVFCCFVDVFLYRGQRC